MGRFLQLITILFFLVPNQSYAFDWASADCGAPNSTQSLPDCSSHTSCTTASWVDGGPGIPANHWTIENYSYVGCGGIVSRGFTYTCDSGYQFNGNLSTPACITQTNQCTKQAGSGQDFSGTGPIPSTFCFDNCEYKASGVGVQIGPDDTGTYSQQASSTGNGCQGSNSLQGNPGTAVGNGHSIQVNTQTKCGSIDGQNVCVGSVPDGSCLSSTSGYSVCSYSPGQSDASPPLPDDGTQGSPAHSDSKIYTYDSNGSLTSVTNYYDIYTTSNSSFQPPRGTVDNANGNGSGNGQGNGSCGGAGQSVCAVTIVGDSATNTVTGSVSISGGSVGITGKVDTSGSSITGQCGGVGQPLCGITGQCGGAGQPQCGITGQCGGSGQPACVVEGACGGPNQPECKIDCAASKTCTNADGAYNPVVPNDVKDFSTSLTDFKSSVAGSQLFDAFGKVSDAIPTGGTPPSSTFQAFGQSFTYAVPQPVIDQVSPVLSLVMKAVWCLVAIRLFLAP